MSTLNPEEADALLRKMVMENGGCVFPCVWGITPGKTSWTDAEQFLATFAQKFKQGGGLYIFQMVVSFRFSDQSPDQSDIYQVYQIFDNRIEWIAFGTEAWDAVRERVGNFDQFLLSNILSTYGSPGGVYIRTFAGTPTGYLPFRLILTYPKQGIFIQYEEEARPNGDQLFACLHDDHLTLYTWDPGTTGILETILSRYEFDIYRPLEEVTRWSIPEFYDYFKDSRHAPCLETPKKYW